MISLVLESDKLPLANTEAVIYNKRCCKVLINSTQPVRFVVKILFFMAEWSLQGKEAGTSQCIHLVGVAALVLGLALFAGISHHGFGFGDVKLLGAVAVCLGTDRTLACSFYGLLMAVNMSLVFLWTGRRKPVQRIPLAPFFLLGYGVTFLV